MKYPLFPVLLLYVIVSLTACELEHVSERTNLSAQASADYSKTHENGISELKYDPLAGVNMCLWTEAVFLGSFSMPVTNGILSVDDQYENSKKSESFFSIKAGLGYVMKGQKFKQGDTKYTFNYLELPIYALYHRSLGETGGLYGGLGPYFAYGLGGKQKSSDFSQPVFGKDNAGYKRFDAGLGFKVGYEFKSGLYADLTYEMGLVNLVYAEADVKSHMRCSSLSVGYNFASFIHKEKKK